MCDWRRTPKWTSSTAYRHSPARCGTRQFLPLVGRAGGPYIGNCIMADTPEEEFMYEDHSELPAILPIFPLPNVVLMPNASLPLFIFEERYKEMVRDCIQGDR